MQLLVNETHREQACPCVVYSVSLMEILFTETHISQHSVTLPLEPYNVSRTKKLTAIIITSPSSSLTSLPFHQRAGSEITWQQIGQRKKRAINIDRAKWLEERPVLLWIIHKTAASERSARGDEHLSAAAED